MVFPALDLRQGHAATGRAVDGQEKFILSCGWRAASAKGRGDQAIGIAQTSWRNRNGDRVGGHASEHSRTVKCESAHPDECRRVGKQVDGEKIGAARLRIVPHRKFWVVTQLRRVGWVNLNGIEKPPATDRTGRLRDSNALPE